MTLPTRLVAASLAGLLALSLAATVSAQDSKSAPLAKQLAAALDAAKLDSVAAKDPAGPDMFVAALYFPGIQLLAVGGRYSAPQLLTDRLVKKEYRDTYLDLNGAATEKIFIEDPGADGLKARRENKQAFDQVENLSLHRHTDAVNPFEELEDPAQGRPLGRLVNVVQHRLVVSH